MATKEQPLCHLASANVDCLAGRLYPVSVIKRLGELGFVILVAFGVGYLAWGLKVDRLSAQVEAMRAALISRIGPSAELGDGDFASYGDVEARLQEQLEACLFEKARLAKETKTTRGPKLLPRTGTAPFEAYSTNPLSPEAE